MAYIVFKLSTCCKSLFECIVLILRIYWPCFVESTNTILLNILVNIALNKICQFMPALLGFFECNSKFIRNNSRSRSPYVMLNLYESWVAKQLSQINFFFVCMLSVVSWVSCWLDLVYGIQLFLFLCFLTVHDLFIDLLCFQTNRLQFIVYRMANVTNCWVFILL